MCSRGLYIKTSLKSSLIISSSLLKVQLSHLLYPATYSSDTCSLQANPATFLVNKLFLLPSAIRNVFYSPRLSRAKISSSGLAVVESIYTFIYVCVCVYYMRSVREQTSAYILNALIYKLKI